MAGLSWMTSTSGGQQGLYAWGSQSLGLSPAVGDTRVRTEGLA